MNMWSDWNMEIPGGSTQPKTMVLADMEILDQYVGGKSFCPTELKDLIIFKVLVKEPLLETMPKILLILFADH